MVLGSPMMHHSQGSQYMWAQHGLPGRTPSCRCSGFCRQYYTLSHEWFLLVSVLDFRTCDSVKLEKGTEKTKRKDTSKCFWLGDASLKTLTHEHEHVLHHSNSFGFVFHLLTLCQPLWVRSESCFIFIEPDKPNSRGFRLHENFS